MSKLDKVRKNEVEVKCDRMLELTEVSVSLEKLCPDSPNVMKLNEASKIQVDNLLKGTRHLKKSESETIVKSGKELKKLCKQREDREELAKKQEVHNLKSAKTFKKKLSKKLMRKKDDEAASSSTNKVPSVKQNIIIDEDISFSVPVVTGPLSKDMVKVKKGGKSAREAKEAKGKGSPKGRPEEPKKKPTTKAKLIKKKDLARNTRFSGKITRNFDKL